MEEAKSSKSGNHDARKSARTVCEESKGTKTSSNQHLKTNKNDRSMKESGKNSAAGNSFKKNKQNDFLEKSGENKSCKTNSRIPELKNVVSSLQDQSQSKAKRLPNVPEATECLKQLRPQHVDEKPPNTHVLQNGASTVTLTTTQSSELENQPGGDSSKININRPNESGKNGLDVRPVEQTSEDSCEYNILFL